MIMLFRILIILLIPNVMIAQTKGNITFGFEYQNVSSKMALMDAYLADTNIFSSSYYNDVQTNTLSNTHGIGFEIGYQPMRFQDFGIGINYQFSYINRTPRIQYPDPVYPSQNIDYKGKYHLKNESFSLNILSKTYFNKLFEFETNKSKLIKRTIIALELQLGIGHMRFREETAFEYPYPSYSQKHNRAAIGTRFLLGLILGYQFNEGSSVASINYKIGYQYFKSQTLMDKGDEIYYVNHDGEATPMHLDFSGLSMGVVIMLRK